MQYCIWCLVYTVCTVAVPATVLPIFMQYRVNGAVIDAQCYTLQL